MKPIISPLDRTKYLDGVKELRDYDHIFLDVEGANHFGNIFGFTIRTYVAHANPNDPKGLTFNDGRRSGRGIAAHTLAMQICNHFKVPFEHKMGRGFQLRMCCDALEAWLKDS